GGFDSNGTGSDDGDFFRCVGHVIGWWLCDWVVCGVTPTVSPWARCGLRSARTLSGSAGAGRGWVESGNAWGADDVVEEVAFAVFAVAPVLVPFVEEHFEAVGVDHGGDRVAGGEPAGLAVEVDPDVG